MRTTTTEGWAAAYFAYVQCGKPAGRLGHTPGFSNMPWAKVLEFTNPFPCRIPSAVGLPKLHIRHIPLQVFELSEPA
jgi:hypothetical protein